MTLLLLSVAAIAAGTFALILGNPAAPGQASPTRAPAVTTTEGKTGLPHYDHVVLAVFENRRQSQVLGTSRAPFLTGLAKQGANFTRSYAIQHPSEPNYLELFSGSNHGVNSDSCPHSFASDNIAHQLIRAGRTFTGYSESLPPTGVVCRRGGYTSNVAPWTEFADLDQKVVNKPFSAFPSDFTLLPTESWVAPNLCHDMHNCPVATGDAWAKAHLGPYARWARTHNSLLIVTFDEDDRHGANRVATIFVGAHIRAGTYSSRIDHYRVLRTVEALYGLPALGAAQRTNPVTDVFSTTNGQPSGLPASGVAYRIAVTRSSRVIDDRRSSAGRGTRMIIYSNHDGSNQRWISHAVGPATYTFRNLASGLCLDNARGSSSPGNRIIQWRCTGASNQLWRILPARSGYSIRSLAGGLALRANDDGHRPRLSQRRVGTVWEFLPG